MLPVKIEVGYFGHIDEVEDSWHMVAVSYIFEILHIVYKTNYMYSHYWYTECIENCCIGVNKLSRSRVYI